MPPRLQVFADHSRLFPGYRAAYPVVSRRAQGVSLGINLNPDGFCNFRCVYCQVPRHELDHEVADPPLDLVLEEIDRLHGEAASGRLFASERLSATPPELRTLRDISLSGDGEPSLYRDLGPLLAALLPRAAAWGVSLQLISNGAGLLRPELRPLLARLRPGRDRVWVKADAWNQRDVKEIYDLTLPIAALFKRLDAVLDLCPCWLQTCVFKSQDTLLSCEPPQRIGSAVEELRRAHPRLERLQIYTLARATFTPGLAPLTDAEILAWAGEVQSRTSLPLQVCGEHGVLSGPAQG